MSLVIVGSLGLDDISTPAGSVHEALGGSAIYAAVAATHFCTPHIVGVVGKDFPHESLMMLKAQGINLDGLEIREGKTFRWGGVYNNWNRAETTFTDLNVFAEFTPQLNDSCKCCKSLLLANIHPQLQLQVLQQIEKYNHVACDTMNYWIGLCPDELAEVLKKVDLVFMNEDEIKDFTKRKDIFSAARELLKLGPQWIIVKRGEYGAVAIARDEMFFFPAYPVSEVIDPTGAGDVFAGAFMGYLARHPQLCSAVVKDAMRYATVLAALNVQNFSIRGILGTSLNEINKLKDEMLIWTT